MVTSPDRLHRGWVESQRSTGSGSPSHVAHRGACWAQLPRGAGLVTVLDGHPADAVVAGAVAGQPVVPLGVEAFGQSGDIPDLYRVYGLDADAIVGAAARLCVQMWGRDRSN